MTPCGLPTYTRITVRTVSEGARLAALRIAGIGRVGAGREEEA